MHIIVENTLLLTSSTIKERMADALASQKITISTIRTRGILFRSYLLHGDQARHRGARRNVIHGATHLICRRCTRVMEVRSLERHYGVTRQRYVIPSTTRVGVGIGD